MREDLGTRRLPPQLVREDLSKSSDAVRRVLSRVKLGGNVQSDASARGALVADPAAEAVSERAETAAFRPVASSPSSAFRLPDNIYNSGHILVNEVS